MITIKKQVSEHFNSAEFMCPHCKQIKIDENLIYKMEHIFARLNASKCIISSGYRCPEYDIQIGGFAGRHSEGLAADCVYYDNEGEIIPSKIVICVAYDLRELNGIADIDGNYVHLDNRVNNTYYGDETRGNSSYWSNPYTYFNVKKSDVEKYTGQKIKYQVHGINKKWYTDVNSGGISDVDTNTYAGIFGIAIDGLFIDNLEYRVKTKNGWLPAVIGRGDYAGMYGNEIIGIAIKNATYRVHVKGGNWLPWVSGYDINDYNNGYAGNGKVIDAIQIK